MQLPEGLTLPDVLIAIRRAKRFVRYRWHGDMEFESEALYAVARSVVEPRETYRYFQASTYLWVRNACWNLFQRQRAERRQERLALQAIARGMLERKEDLEGVRRAVEGLDEDSLDLVHRRFVLNQSVDEISYHYGMSRVAVYNRLKVIFKKMRAEIERER